MMILPKLYPDLNILFKGLDKYSPNVIGEGSVIPWSKYIPDKFSLPNIGDILTMKGILHHSYITDVPLLGKISVPLKFGRLVSLFEAAGKIRIIAIVDPITQ